MGRPQDNGGPGHKRRTFLYSFAKVLAWILFHTVYPVKVHGREHLNLQGPCIVIANHLSGLDPVCVAHAAKGDEITFLAKKELMKSSFSDWLLRGLHAIPVDRHNSDMSAMRACMQVLKDGRVLGIFPEGTRYKKGNMEELEGGVAIMALRSQVPVIPAYIHGKLRPFHQVHVYAKPPMDLRDLREMGVGKEASDMLLSRIAGLYKEFAKKAEERR
jgi:1-acyl-sn-glycerol-3-phosphate acyltransferase